jgi:hypothetical protein
MLILKGPHVRHFSDGTVCPTLKNKSWYSITPKHGPLRAKTTCTVFFSFKWDFVNKKRGFFSFKWDFVNKL